MKIKYNLIFTVVIIVLSPILINACADFSFRNRNFAINDLLLKEEELPEGWSLIGKPGKSIDYDRSPVSIREDFINKIYPNTRGGFLDVYQYKNTVAAKDDFNNILEEYNLNRSDKDWKFYNGSFEQAGFGCESYPNTTEKVCGWTAQYEEFIVLYITWLAPNMSIVEMQNFAKTIDLKMETYIKPNKH